MTTVASQPDVFAYDPDGFWDEMFAGPGQVRPYYAPLTRALSTLSPADVERRQRAADLSFQARGITFAVNQEHEGIEKIMPFDLVPRIITAAEWRTIERGLEQRVRALNLFLLDIYQTARILRQGIVQADLVLGSRGYRREVRGMTVPLGVYTHVVGSDLVRDASGEFYVLEDNLRTPSGVSYVVENRRVLKRVWSSIFHGYDVRPVEGYAQDLLDVLLATAPSDSEEEPTVVLLTPGVYNSAYFEHAFLAKGMGVQMVEGSDLFVDDGTVFMRTTRGPQRVHVIYRRVDDDFLDPLAFRADSILGVPGLLASYRMGRVSLANAPGVGVADDKAIYAYVPSIIRYYLDEEPILPTIRTYLPTKPDELQFILEHIRELVVKSVNESGGYGMLIGPHSTEAQRDEYRERVRANPRGYIAQPTLALSRHPCWVDDHFEGRHVDLRPFVLFGRDVKVSPGGLTRVAMRRGSLVVNSSQGGGGKDTWVLAEHCRRLTAMSLLCRVAEHMFWLNRYVERAVATIRVVDVTAHLELDAGDADAEQIDFWTPLLGPALDGVHLQDAPRPQPIDVRYYLAFDPDNPSSLISCVRHARAAAREVRDSISSEMWEQINTTYLMLTEPDRMRDVEEDLHAFYKQIRDSLMLIQGLADATIAHDEAWHFLSLGMYLERADNVSRLLRLQSHLIAGSASVAGDDTVRWLAVLRSAGSAEAYSRYYSLRVEITRVLEFLLLNPTFPQSVRYSLSAARQALESIALATEGSAGPPVRALGLLHARLEHASVDEVIEFGLEEFLDDIQRDIARVSERITRAFFQYGTPTLGRHMAVARAAQIMAAQQ